MYYIQKMTKTTMKLLLRNKGFLFFGIILPILATLVLNVKDSADMLAEKEALTELESVDVKLAYINDYKMLSVKVYDSSETDLSAKLLEDLAKEGVFQIYRADSRAYSKEEIMENAKQTALEDKVGSIMMISEDFSDEVLAGEIKDSVTLYKTEADDRFELLEQGVETLLTEYTLLGKQTGNEKELLENLKEKDEAAGQVEMKEYATEEGISKLDVNYKRTGVLGYALALYSISFMLSGIMILNTILTEKSNLVYTRIMLTNAGNASYIASKFLVILVSTILQTGIIGAAYTVLVTQKTGLPLHQFMFVIFMMGLIFNSLSVCVGICCGNVLTATYTAFFLWMTTALLGGLYFDISAASDFMQRVAMLMPQRWGMLSANMMFKGDMMAYPTLIMVTISYLIVILMIGILGLKINRKE